MDLPVTLPDIVCKIIIIGDSGVGKTTVARRFTRNSFSESLSETFGIVFANIAITSIALHLQYIL